MHQNGENESHQSEISKSQPVSQSDKDVVNNNNNNNNKNNNNSRIEMSDEEYYNYDDEDGKSNSGDSSSPSPSETVNKNFNQSVVNGTSEKKPTRDDSITTNEENKDTFPTTSEPSEESARFSGLINRDKNNNFIIEDDLVESIMRHSEETKNLINNLIESKKNSSEEYTHKQISEVS